MSTYMNKRPGVRILVILATLAAVLVGAPGSASAQTPTCNGLPATIVGTNGNDVIQGTIGNDVIVALGGQDVIYGDRGNDTICGGTGRDYILGGPGRDYLNGEKQNDRVVGGAGADYVVGGSGRDILKGGAGSDIMKGQGGNDRRVSGGPGPDVLDGGAGINNCDPDGTDKLISCLGYDDSPVPGYAQVSGVGNTLIDLIELGINPLEVDVIKAASTSGTLVKVQVVDHNLQLAETAIFEEDGGTHETINRWRRSDLGHIAIEHDGAWVLTLRSYANKAAKEPWNGGATSGTGSVVLMGVPNKTNYTMNHSGDGNFIIWAYNTNADRRLGLVVNEIDTHSGSHALPSGTRLLTVRAAGNWSIS